MKKFTPYILLGLIILIALSTRFYKLGAVPAGLYLDEAAQGYSAYSILMTGKDEFGKAFPVVFRSFTDFRTPVYTYLICPLIPIFSLTSLAVRLPSAIFSLFTFPILYFLIQSLLSNERPKKRQSLGLVACLLLAISPWHTLFGRTDYETTVALFLLLSGVLAFYKGLKRPIFIVFSAVLLSLSLVAYQSERIVVPLILIAFFVRYKKILLTRIYRPYVLTAFLIGLAVLAPTLSVALTPGFWARATGLNIFSHLRQMPDGFIAAYYGVLNPIINSSWFLSTREFFSLYFSYFSPRLMFNLGDYGPRSSFPDLSTFFIWQFPFYIWGFWTLFKRKALGELKFFVIVTLLIAPIPAAVTRDPYTTIRALALVIPQIMIISLGVQDIYLRIKNKYLKIASFAIFLTLIIYSLLKLYSSIIILNEYYRARHWDWGWREVTETVQTLDQNIPITIDHARSNPDLQIAFFLKYDPAKYQKENFEISLSEYYTNLYRNPIKHIGNITIRIINWKDDLIVNQYLVGDELGISTQQIKEHHLTLISEIKYPDGSVAYRIVKTNPVWEKAQRKGTWRVLPTGRELP